MLKRFLTAISIAFSLFSLPAAPARAQKPVTLTVMRKGEDIGTQSIRFDRQGDTLKVSLTTRIAVKVLFVTAYKFTFDGAETWKDGKLVALDDRTNDNGERHDVHVEQKNGKLMLTADGTSREISADTIPGSWWNSKLADRKELLDVFTGKIEPVSIRKLGREKVKVGGGEVMADHYEVTGGLQRNLWFTPDGTVVRQTVVKKGDLIEYVTK